MKVQKTTIDKDNCQMDCVCQKDIVDMQNLETRKDLSYDNRCNNTKLELWKDLGHNLEEF